MFNCHFSLRKSEDRFLNIKPNNSNTKCVLLQGLRVINSVVVCIVSQGSPTVLTVVLQKNLRDNPPAATRAVRSNRHGYTRVLTLQAVRFFTDGGFLCTYNIYQQLNMTVVRSCFRHGAYHASPLSRPSPPASLGKMPVSSTTLTFGLCA